MLKLKRMNLNLLMVAKIGFPVLTVAFLHLFLREIRKGIHKSDLNSFAKNKTYRNIVTILMGWALIVSIWSFYEFMANWSIFPLNLLPVIAIPLVTVIVTLFSPRLSLILDNIPQENLVALQSFRFFVELLLWALFAVNVLPEQMTFEGRNFDILVGITAPIIAGLIKRNKISRTGLILWNFAGLALLINIVTVAILSTPSPLRVFMNEPANTIVTQFPVSWLPGLLVPLAYTLHFYSLKQLLSKHKSR